MKKVFIGLFVLIIATINANANQTNIYYFKKDIPSSVKYSTRYRIKISSNKYLKNAKAVKRDSKLNTYILKGIKYYGVYVGSFKYKKSARKVLKNLKKIYKGAYIIETYTPINKIKKRKKPRKIKVVKIKKAQLNFQ